MTKDTLPSPGDDALDAEADEWMAECGVKEMVANIAVVFASWASPELLARFREQVEAIMHLSFVEGAIRSRDTLPSPVSVPEGDDLEDVAYEIARWIDSDAVDGSARFRAIVARRITAALLSAESRARREGREEMQRRCFSAAVGPSNHDECDHGPGYADGRMDAGEAIRALPLSSPETIEHAAIKHDGIVYAVPRPGRHHDVIRKMAAKRLGPGAMRYQGFVTSSGRFVDRKEAAKIARAAGQIKTKTGPENELFSEDVW